MIAANLSTTFHEGGGAAARPLLISPSSAMQHMELQADVDDSLQVEERSGRFLGVTLQRRTNRREKRTGDSLHRSTLASFHAAPTLTLCHLLIIRYEARIKPRSLNTR